MIAPSPKQEAARLVVGLPSHILDIHTARALKKGEIAGVILMGRNLGSRKQVRKLTNDLRYIAISGGQPEPLIMVDQEGGAVDRLAKVLGYRSPSARQLANRGEKAVRNAATRSAKALRDLGINVNLAPVADLAGPTNRSVIGSRSFGKDPNRVAKYASTFVEVSQNLGVAACVKHYPGHGVTLRDTHIGPVVSQAPRSVIEQHRRAFHLVFRSKPRLVMVGHVIYRHLDPDRPASTSPKIIAELKKQAPESLIVTDSGDMGAMRSLGTEAHRAAKAIQAGADLYLTTTTLRTAPNLPGKLAALVAHENSGSDRILQLRTQLALSRSQAAPEGI